PKRGPGLRPSARRSSPPRSGRTCRQVARWAARYRWGRPLAAPTSAHASVSSGVPRRLSYAAPGSAARVMRSRIAGASTRARMSAAADRAGSPRRRHQAAGRVEELLPRPRSQADRQGVDGEITSPEILSEGRRLDLGERPGARVSLAARRGEVDPPSSGQLDGRGEERRMLPDSSPQPSGEAARDRSGVALDGQVEVGGGGRSCEKEVSDESPDEPDLGPGGGFRRGA